MRKLALFCALVLCWLPASAATVSINSQGWLTIDQKTVLPLGIYNVPVDELSGLDLRINMVMNPFWTQGDRSSPAFLDAIRPYDLYGIVGLDSDEAKRLDLPAISKYVEAVKGHPNLLAYNLPDEAVADGFSHADLVMLYRTVKAAAPDQIVILTDFQAGSSAITDAYDVFAYSDYPIGTTSIQTYRRFLLRIIADAFPKPVWPILQAYVSGEQWIEPTRAELRAIAYLALINGAKGLLVFQHGSEGATSYLKNFPDLQMHLRELMIELHQYEAVWLQPEPASVGVHTNALGLDAMVRQLGTKYYVFAVNWRSQTDFTREHDPGVELADVQVRLAGVGDGKVSIVAGEGQGQTMELRDGFFTHTFPPYAAIIFEVVRLP